MANEEIFDKRIIPLLRALFDFKYVHYLGRAEQYVIYLKGNKVDPFEAIKVATLLYEELCSESVG